MKKAFLIILGAVILTGCVLTPPPQAEWYRPNTSRMEAKNYQAECIYNVGMNKVEPHKEGKLIEACMIKAGFRWGIPPQN